MIFTFGRRLVSIANPDWVPRDTAEVLQFGKTVAEDTGMSVYQNSAPLGVPFSLQVWLWPAILIHPTGLLPVLWHQCPVSLPVAIRGL
jgi:hypothetical protein